MTTVKFDATQGVGYVLDGEGDFDESAHPRDEKGQFTVVASGNTYGHKEKLKAAGYKYNAQNKTWERQVSLTQSEFERAHIASKDVPAAEQEAHKAFRQSITGGQAYKDVQLELTNGQGAVWATSRYKVIHRGTDMPSERARVQNTGPDRAERNRAMHEALGHSGYKHIPGSAPDDLH